MREEKYWISVTSQPHSCGELWGARYASRYGTVSMQSSTLPPGIASSMVC